MNKAWLLIGGNIGNRENYLSRSREMIEKRCGAIIECSSVYETAAWGLTEQNPFYNQCILVETKLPPLALLKTILSIEEGLGRRRELRYGPRVIDIDILLFNDEIIKTEGLTIPHPQLQNRRFVLVPLNEIGSTIPHPVLQKTIGRLLQECTDDLPVQKITQAFT